MMRHPVTKMEQKIFMIVINLEPDITDITMSWLEHGNEMLDGDIKTFNGKLVDIINQRLAWYNIVVILMPPWLI